MSTRNELQEAKNAAAVALKEYHSKNDKEWNAEHEANWTRLNKEHDDAAAALAAHLTSEQAACERAARIAEIEAGQRSLTNDRRVGLDEEQRREHNPEYVAARSERTRELTLQAWCLTQARMDLSDEHRDACRELGFNPTTKEISLGDPSERRYGPPAFLCGEVQKQREVRVGLDVATSGAAKETIPQGFMAELEQVTLAYGAVRQVCRVIGTSTGNSMPWPVVDDTANVAAILAEATTIGTSVDPTFSAITFLAYKLSSKPVFASNEILQDSAFNLSSYLAEAIGVRFGRGENVYFTTGTNSSQPQGIVAAAGTGVTSAAAAAFTADELLGLIHSLNPSYRSLPSTGFMMHDTCLLYVRKFKDANGQYLWQPGMQSGVPDRLAGYPVNINQQMEPLVSNVPVTAKKHVLFSAHEKYVIRDCGPVRMYHLTERYRDVDQDCFIAFKRVDGRTLNAAAHKVLLQA